MPSYSARSKARLETCDPKLQALFEEVIRHWDCTILEGRRDQATQDEYFRTGRSKVQWPNSKHNAIFPALSRAVDCAPYPIDWNDHKRFIHFAGFVLGVASTMSKLCRQYSIPSSAVKGHREMSGAATECPGTFIDLDLLRAAVSEVLGETDANA